MDAGFLSTKEQFLKYLQAVKNASPHTIRNYQIDLNALHAFIDPILSDYPIAKIDRKVLRQFLAQLTTLKQNKKTIVRRLSTLRSFLNTRSLITSLTPILQKAWKRLN